MTALPSNRRWLFLSGQNEKKYVRKFILCLDFSSVSARMVAYRQCFNKGRDIFGSGIAFDCAADKSPTK